MTQRDDLHHRMEKVIEQYLRLDAALKKSEDKYFRVCIFGSARIQPDDVIYQRVYELAGKLAHLGIDVVTGGGPGLMEAANSGVKDAHLKNVRSYGLPLNIPGLPEVPNSHLDIKSMHQRFSSRLDEFMRLSDGVIVAPGGIGTLLELFYVWQLIQIGLIPLRPVALLGKEYWQGLMDWMNGEVLSHHLISPKDMERMTLVDTADEAIAVIEPAYRVFKETLDTTRDMTSDAIQEAGKEVTPSTRVLKISQNQADLISEARSNGLKD